MINFTISGNTVTKEYGTYTIIVSPISVEDAFTQEELVIALQRIENSTNCPELTDLAKKIKDKLATLVI